MKKYLSCRILGGCAILAFILVYSCKHDIIGKKDGTGAVKETSSPKLQINAAKYYIPNKGISDHADATIPGSIAWYFATYGGGTAANPVTYYLNSDTVYNCKKRLIFPAHARLSESGVDAKIQVDPVNWVTSDRNEFIQLNTGSYILHVELMCNYKETIGIYSHSDSVKILDVTVSNTAKVDESKCIWLALCNYVTIDHCLLRRAGCDNTETNFTRRGYLIHMSGGTHDSITNNDIAFCGSSGIGFFQTRYVMIANNIIHEVGRANIPEYVSDGITSYHDQTGTLNRSIIIKDNSIYNSLNHGIHVSGYGISITGNHIYACSQANLYLGDQRNDANGPPDCTSSVFVDDNNFGVPGAAYSIYQAPVLSGTIHFSGNTGTTTMAPPSYCN